MKQDTNSFMTKDGYQIHTVSWLPEETAQAVIVLVHGYGEHSARYQHVAEKLVSAGYAVYSLDHRGHGKSEGMRAYFAHINQPVKDLRYYIVSIKEQHPGLPLFIIGHSMGTLISLHYALKYQDELTGLVLSGAAVNADETVPVLLQTLARLLRSIIPTVPLTPSLPSDAICTDPEVVKKYDTDPLVYRGKWRIGMGAELLRSGKQLRESAHQITIPLLILHGEEDEIAPPSGSQVLYDRANSTDKMLKMWPGMRHEIMNEIGKEEVLGNITKWIAHHL